VSNNIRDKLKEITSSVVEELGYELVDMKYGKEGKQWVLRVFIDHSDGIGLEDCERVSRSLSDKLDQDDPIPHRYILEVSSPGLDRPLKKDEDFERFKEHPVVIKTNEAVEGKRKIEGILMGLKDDRIVIFSDGIEIFIPRDIVSSVRLMPQFK